MSLIRRHHVLVASAALAAVAMPVWLLKPGELAREDGIDLLSEAPGAVPPGAAPIDPVVSSMIFSSSRAPDLTLAIGDNAPGTDGVEAAPPPALPQLVGLVTQRRGGAVALARGSDGATELLRKGDSLDGWRLIAFGRDNVTFEMAGDRQVSPLDFRNRTNGSQAAGVPPSENATIDASMPQGMGG